MKTMKTKTGNETWKGLVRQYMRRAAMTLVMMVMTLTAGAKTVTLTSETGQVTLNNGDVVTGTGGANTYLVVSEGATVTLSGVDITNYTRDEDNEIPTGIACLGDATIILAKGTTNTIIGCYYLDPCIKVGPEGTTLTIKGYGTLVLRSWGWGSCIGSRNKEACGNIVIEGGTLNLSTTIESQGKLFSSGAACIGSSGNGGRCGDITISGGNIRAISDFGAAAIGSGASAHSVDTTMVPISCYCGNINITGGTIYAYPTSARGGAAIGGGYNGHCGNISISGVTSVSAVKDSRRSPYCIGPAAGDNSTCGTLTLWGQTSGYIVGPTGWGTEVLAPTDVPYTVSFDANFGTGSMSDQGFYSNTPQALTANEFSLSGKAFKCWSTESDGSGYDYYDGETVTNLGNVTLYAQWANPDYVVSFDKNANDAMGTMAGQNFAMNTTQMLNANTFVYPGYAFVKWNTAADGSGTSYTDKQAVSDLGNVTLFAQWTPTTYTITYVDAVNGTDNATNNNPTTYAYMDNAITLTDPMRVGHDFVGWTYEGQDSPTKSVTIAKGTYGDLTFTAHWTAASDAVITENTGYYELQNGQTLSGTGGAHTHITIADGATVTLSGVTITGISNDHWWAGITCLGDATVILAEGTTNSLTGGFLGYPGISAPENKTLTIRGKGTLYAGNNGKGRGIGPDSWGGGRGNITIEGGTIFATGATDYEGIGGTYSGNITITDGVTSVTATAGTGAPYSIGTGSGTVTIGGVETGNLEQSTTIYKPADESTVNVQFDANGGTGGPMAVQNLYRYRVQQISACGFTREHYDYGGWNTKADGSGANYPAGQYVAGIDAETLYAQWTLHNYHITYNLDGGTNPGSNPDTYTNESSDITLAAPTRYGYDFVGWTYEGQNDPTLDVTIPTGSSGDKTYTAHWTAWAIVTLTNKSGQCVVTNDFTLTGTGGRNTRVDIADGATVTLRDVTISDITDNKWAGITCLGDATIILSGNNTVTGGYYSAGIFVPEGKTLTIKGSGTLNATGHKYSAGIGGSHNKSCGNITITSEVSSVTATAGANAPYSIGSGGGQSTAGVVIIGGMNTGCIPQSPFMYVPNNQNDNNLTNGYTVTFDANEGEGTMDPQVFTPNTLGYLNACTFTRDGYYFAGWNTKPDGSGRKYADRSGVKNLGNTTLYAQWTVLSIVNLMPNTGEVTLYDHQTLTGTGGMNTHVTIADGATVTLSGVNITLSNQWAGITCLGDATIILAEGTTNKVKGAGMSNPGIYVPENKTLTIKGTGTLNASSEGTAAGIGGGMSISCGHIVLEDGTVNATGGSFSAGIGGGKGSVCGNISITGGTVTATSKNATGIGSADNGSCGTITISDGNVTATGSNNAAGIGSGIGGSCGAITITGGNVTATGGNRAGPIGSGPMGSCGTVTIGDGLIDETSGYTRTIHPLTYDLWVNGKQITSVTRLDILGDGTMSFDPRTNTLTLDNPTQNVPIRSEGIDLTVKGVYKMTAEAGDVALDVAGGTLTLEGDFTLRGAVTGVQAGRDMNVKGQLRTYGISGSGIHYAGTGNAWLTLQPGFFGTTRVEMQGGTKALSYTDGNVFRIASGFVLSEPAGGVITSSPDEFSIIEGGSLATRAVFTIAGTASGDGSAAHPFEIGNGEQWAKACADVANGCETEGLHFQLIGGFTATTMMGTAYHPFAGTITGDFYSFNVIADINATKGVAALFPYVSGASISDLCVKGDIVGGAGSAGIVGQAVGGTTTLSAIVFDGTMSTTSGEPAENLIVGNVASGATVAITKCLDVSHHIWAESNTPAYRLYGSGMSLLMMNNTGIMYDRGIWAPAGSTIEFTVIGNMGNVVATDGTLTSLGGYNYSIEMPASNVGIVEANAHPFEFACVNDGVMENGSIRTNRGISGEVAAGTPIYVVAVPNDYCLLEKITVMTVDGNEEIAVDEDHFFTMPNKAVTISATFKKKYSYENGVLHLLCGDFSGGGSIHSWDPLEVSSAGVTSVVADRGVRFTGLCVGLFQNLTNCTEMDLHNVETSAMTDMRGMFSSCEKLQTLNMTGWNTANVTNMDNMFEACYLLTELDLSMFNTSAVTDFNQMFENCGVYKLTLPAGMAVTTDMELKNGKRYQENNNERRSGWIILESDGTVVSGPATETYAAIAASSEPKTYVWQWMPDEFVLELPDNQDNRDLIRTWHGVTTNVKLTGRTLYKDGDWNTLCLPFDMSASSDDVDGVLSVDYMVLDVTGKYDTNGDVFYNGDGQDEADFTLHTGFDEATGTLNLYFMTPMSYEPGTPYIICWYDGGTIESPTFNNVTITKTMNNATSEDGKVTFTGTYDYRSFPDADKSILFLGLNNKLFYPEPGPDPNDNSITLYPSIGAFRAYFQLNGITAGQVNSTRMFFGDEETSISDAERLNDKGQMINDSWFSLDGRKLHALPTARGIYLNNGRKVVVK